MGRFKNIELKGLLINDFEKKFASSIARAIKSLNVSEEEALKKLEPKWDGILSTYEETIASAYVEQHKFNLDKFLKQHLKSQQRIAKSHGESFTSFILYINGCFNIYEKIVKKLEGEKIDSTLKMTVALYGLIIRRADEILNQLLSGYIDGAMILWRSLYENAIILLVLALENNNNLADRYFQHSVRSSRKKILSYQKNYKELKFKALTKSTEEKLKSEVEKMNSRYGKDFLKNDYGWADNLFEGRKKANFMLLEERTEMTRFRPYYIMCCEQIHSNFNGFQKFMDGGKIILHWLLKPQIEFGDFVDPMQFTVGILNEINDFILYEFSVEEEYNVNVLLMNKVFEKQQRTFEKLK